MMRPNLPLVARREDKGNFVRQSLLPRNAGRMLLSLVLAASFAAATARPARVCAGPSETDYREAIRARQQQESAGRASPGESQLALAQRETMIQPVSSQPQLPPKIALLSGPGPTSAPAPVEVLAEIPDPVDADQVFARRLAEIERTSREVRVVNGYRRVIEKAKEFLGLLQTGRTRRVNLSLEECVQRALANNYQIRVESYNPAISRTALVQAESAFDAVFFLDATYDNQDRAVPTQLASGQSDTRSGSGGIRQLLPTGMQAQLALSQQRSFSDLRFNTVNPAYSTNFTATITQPLLRGFGLDYNRAGIEIARTDLRISQEQFVQQVRETLFAVEQAYWLLMQARRTTMIQAEAVGQNFVTWQSMIERLDHDATPVEVANSESQYLSRLVNFQEAVKIVRDAEDALKNLLNDPEFKLSDPVEIVPVATPMAAAIAVDLFAEVRTALDARSEIHAARLGIERARIQTARAKNETLPRLDVALRYDVSGLNDGADASFDNMTTNRFRSYTVSLSFEYPIGNRGPLAAYRGARQQESQAVVRLHQVMDTVVTEVNDAIRELVLRYDQIPPQLTSVRAAERNLRALQARSDRVNPSFLETELNGVDQLAQTRQRLLQVITNYNIAIVGLERAKGTLLEYDNVVVADADTRR